MSLMCWNARGLGSPRAFRNLFLCIRKNRPNLLFVMESKLAAGCGERFRLRLSFDSVFEVPRNGLRGGLLLFWNSAFDVNILNYSSNHIDYCMIMLLLYPGLFLVILMTIYLLMIVRVVPLPPPSAMMHFQNFIQKFSFSPLHPVGNVYTWKHGSLFERLDWCIANNNWHSLFPRATLHHLGFYGSDHRVLKVVLQDESMQGSIVKTFMFENHWLMENSFFDTVKSAWTNSNLPSYNNKLDHFLLKQGSCVQAIQNWNSSSTSLSKRINTLEKSINTLTSNLPLSQDQLNHVHSLQSQLDSLLLKQEVFWKQRSKVHWLQAGDRNTKYFHKTASIRKRGNFIRSLKCENGQKVSTFPEISQEILTYFSTLFTSQSSNQAAISTILSAINTSLAPDQISFLNSPFTENEVHQALFQLSGDKAPGLDGLNPSFYQKNWHVIGHDLSLAILDILNGNTALSPINNTLTVLIPKKSHATTLKDYRPISLCSTLYKIVAKTIANRLKLVIGSIISPNQGAFISDRIIFDNILIAQEVVHAINHRKQGKLGWVGLKLDMEKAFDRVEWDFLIAILQHFQFPPKFINLIYQCVSTVSIRFKVNGSITNAIYPSRGIRQGDPLSPYLFLLCSEGLSAALKYQERVGLLRGISISRHAPQISHLLFADDTLLFTTATVSSCHAIKEALAVYHLASGQTVNFSKSSMLFSPNTPTSISDYFFQHLGMTPKPFISKYLGVPQCFGRSKKDSFDFILHRVSSHLNVWNSKLFSKAGKEVLLKAVIQAIPSYAMSCFRLPVSICHKIEKLMAQFWWGSMGKGSKIHWKSWNHLCVSKFFGGLGFRSLVHHNQAMLAKQAWHIYSNPNSLLFVVLKAKYFHHSTFLDADLGHTPSFTWRSVLWGRDLLKKGLLWKVGNGETIRTVEDFWVPEVRKIQYKAGCSPPSDKVSFFLHPEGYWNREALNTYFDPPTVSSILHVPIGGCDKEDFLIWNNHPSGILSVKSAYHIANAGSLPPSSSNSSLSKKWWTTLWSLNIPPKVKTFIWRVYHHILPVSLNLFLKKSLPSPSCSSCNCPTETVSHALLDCSSAAKSWKLSPFRSFFLSNRHQDIKWFLVTAFTDLPKKDLMHFLGLLWAIWHNRNRKLFADFFMLPNDVVSWASAFITDFQDAQLKKQSALALQPSSPHQYSSSRLSQGFYRLNTDAAKDVQSGKLGFGAVIRDWKNRIVAGLSTPVPGNVNPLMAEALSLRSSLLWCYNIKIPLAVIETDSKVLVEKIRNEKSDLSALSDVIQDIRLSLSYFPTASIRYIARSFNRNAHCLARKALGLDREKCWNGSVPVL
ncbi:uncharacterized protein LOC115696715 [Cannabis sativa]|uniref:uncharacterized protein LOC115696715 n=1 Tax=Cannabis sativa TaxID=3483 RepID=UPI0029C9E430|nr:uncharacterized protein LOC115696715 [Cannabis sativa]